MGETPDYEKEGRRMRAISSLLGMFDKEKETQDGTLFKMQPDFADRVEDELTATDAEMWEKLTNPEVAISMEEYQVWAKTLRDEEAAKYPGQPFTPRKTFLNVANHIMMTRSMARPEE